MRRPSIKNVLYWIAGSSLTFRFRIADRVSAISEPDVMPWEEGEAPLVIPVSRLPAAVGQSY